MNNILEMIGEPAALEQLAEECSELGKAALKLARKMRGENPTPKSMPACVQDLTEEVADVIVCMKVLCFSEWWNRHAVADITEYKLARWEQRLKEGESHGKS